MPIPLTPADCIGLARPAVDAHTLGLSSLAQVLQDCGYRSVIADAAVCQAIGHPQDPQSPGVVADWLARNRITVLGFSYRLDPKTGAELFARWFRLLRERRLLAEEGGPLKALYFAGLPETCARVRQQSPGVAGVFCGDETPAEILRALGVDAAALPRDVAAGSAYDEARLQFGRDLVRRGGYRAVRPVDRSGSRAFGQAGERLTERLDHGRRQALPPLMRAYVGPYLPDRAEAVSLFLKWTRDLAAAGLLDILSIGTSQLTQSHFGDDWTGMPNGGGVPLNSEAEFRAVWDAARPMLVRTYAGTRNVPALAEIHERAIHIAWHALSLWWFSRMDGRGPNAVRDNLQQHIDTLRYIAATGKPFEANVPHHFAFRGADDVTYVLSAVLAARLAKRLGVRHFIFQNMLNTPKGTWGVQDLAKSRAALHLLRELQDERFQVILQPRGGLDYFSHDLDKARAQLAAVTALMDDIEPSDPTSPAIIHVVSFSEGAHLADPAVVNESVQITRHALDEYRRLRREGAVDDMAGHPDVQTRTEELLQDARTVLQAIEKAVPDAYSAEGLYQIFASGFLPVPYLWECREEFAEAVRWPTRLVHGGVRVVDESGAPVTASDRMRMIAARRAGAAGTSGAL